MIKDSFYKDKHVEHKGIHNSIRIIQCSLCIRNHPVPYKLSSTCHEDAHVLQELWTL